MLLAMFPERFFFDATMLIALLTVVQAWLLAFGSEGAKGSSPQRAQR